MLVVSVLFKVVVVLFTPARVTIDSTDHGSITFLVPFDHWIPFQLFSLIYWNNICENDTSSNTILYLTPSPLDPEQSQQTAGQQTDTTQPPEPASYTDIDSFISKVDATPSVETNSKPIVKLPSGQAGEYITYEVGK